MLITFGLLNKKLLIPFIFPLFVNLRRFIRDEEYKKIKNPFFKIFCTYLSFTLCGFLYLIILYQLREEKNKNNKNNVKNLSHAFLLVKNNTAIKEEELIDLNSINSQDNPLKKEEEKIKRIKNRKQFAFIILITLLELIALLIQDIWKEHQKINSEYRLTIAVLFELLFLTLFSIIFLKYQIYRHQKFSLFVLVLCLITFFIESIIYNDDSWSEIIRNIIYFSSAQLFYCLDNVLGKRYLDNYFDHIYLYMFKIGIFGLIPILLYDGIVELFFDDPDCIYHGIIIYFRTLFQTKEKIYLFVLDLFFGCIWETSLWLTIYYFTPLHFIILEVLGEFIETTLNIIKPSLQPKIDNYKTGQILSFYIIYPIVIFCVLIFTEIIILNFFGLNYNTRYFIILRQKIDGAYDIDKDGKIIPANNMIHSTMIDSSNNNNDDDEEEDDNNNNGIIFI